jgi:RNA polymerase primary sigma factor
MGYGHEPLSQETIVDLCRSIKAGIGSEKGSSIHQAFIAARNRLVTANLALVVSWLNCHPQTGRHDREDMIQEGALGIVEAAVRFDPDRGTKFSTYAEHWIMNFIVKFVKGDSVCSVKGGAWNANGAINRAWKRLIKAGLPTDDESLRKEAGLSVARFKSAAKCHRQTRFDSEYPIAHGQIPSGESEVDDIDEANHRRSVVASSLRQIDERQSVVLQRRFSIGCDRLTQREIGLELGVSKEWARRLEQDGIDAMTKIVGGMPR